MCFMLGHPGNPTHSVVPWVRSFGPAVLACLIGVILTVIAFQNLREQEARQIRSEFDRRVENHMRALQQRISSHGEHLLSLRNLFRYSDRVSRTDFAEAARDLLHRHPGIQAFKWVPRVPAGARGTIETAGRIDGLADYEFKEFDRTGRIIRAAERDEYFPLHYIEPQQPNARLLGWDVASDPRRMDWLDQACESGEPVASERIALSKETRPQASVTWIAPVFATGQPVITGEQRRAHLLGYVLGMFRVGEAVEAALGGGPFGGLEVLLVDATAAGTNRFLYFHSGNAAPSQIPNEAEFRGPITRRETVRMGPDREWNFIFRASPEFAAEFTTAQPWYTLLGGIAFSMLLMAYLMDMGRRTQFVQAQVEERTSELQKALRQVEQEILERRQTEEALRENKSLLEQAQSVAHLGSWIYDAEAERLVSWSKETVTIFGLSEDVFDGRMDLLRERIHPEDRPLVDEAWRSVFGQAGFYNIEHRLALPDGSLRWVNQRAKAVRSAEGRMLVRGAIQDITERRISELALRESEERLRSVVQVSPDAILVCRDEQVVFVNKTALTLFGATSARELLGKSLHDLVPPEDREILAERRWQVLNLKIPLPVREQKIVRLDGQVLEVELALAPFVDQGKTSLLAMLRDITERKWAEAERQELNRKLLEAQKLESLGVLAGGIAHDFNNLLTGILCNASLARLDLAPGSPPAECLAQIESTSVRAAELCKQMLAYSGKGQFLVQNLDLTSVVGETLKLLQVSIGKKVSLQLNLAQGLPSVTVDSTQIRQVIMNLVINASEAIGDRPGTITISTGTVIADRNYLSRMVLDPQLPEGNYVWLEVADTGCGMNTQTIEKIFDPFFTTKFTGRGLGLAAVLGIVRGHRGALKVWSEPGRGATFRMLLPASGEPSEPDSNQEPPLLGWRSSGTVLVVDDEEHVRLVVARTLEHLGFRTVLARDGLEALHAYQEPSAEFILVLLDLTMPKLDGAQTFQEMRRLKPGQRIVLMSGFDQREAVARFAGKGLAGFVQKPFKPATLREAIEHALQEKPECNAEAPDPAATH
jgi:PAS domain S-box-containing protein